MASNESCSRLRGEGEGCVFAFAAVAVLALGGVIHVIAENWESILKFLGFLAFIAGLVLVAIIIVVILVYLVSLLLDVYRPRVDTRGASDLGEELDALPDQVSKCFGSARALLRTKQRLRSRRFEYRRWRKRVIASLRVGLAHCRNLVRMGTGAETVESRAELKAALSACKSCLFRNRGVKTEHNFHCKVIHMFESEGDFGFQQTQGGGVVENG